MANFSPFKEKIWLSTPTMHGPELEYMMQAYNTNWMSTVGANINEVEKLTCEKVGCKHAVALATGTSALHMAVKLAGIKTGEKAVSYTHLDVYKRQELTMAVKAPPMIMPTAILITSPFEINSLNSDMNFFMIFPFL